VLTYQQKRLLDHAALALIRRYNPALLDPFKEATANLIKDTPAWGATGVANALEGIVENVGASEAENIPWEYFLAPDIITKSEAEVVRQFMLALEKLSPPLEIAYEA
jgi:hypothetical protein